MTYRALVYGDIDLNLIDGSAIWLQSVTQALARAGCAVTLVLKAPVRTSRLIAPLLAEPGVTVGGRSRSTWRTNQGRSGPRPPPGCWPGSTRTSGTTWWCCAAAR